MTTKDKLLWISPNLTHYKERFLDKLAHQANIAIFYIGCAQDETLGYRSHGQDSALVKTLLHVTKSKFGFSLTVFNRIFITLKANKFENVLVPAEKKFLILILYLYFLKFFFSYNMVAYNHALIKSSKLPEPANIIISRLIFLYFDKIIFYTEENKFYALRHRIVNQKRAFHANNTLDSDLIWSKFKFRVNLAEDKILLFIGRLTPKKNLDLLFRYFEALKLHLPSLKLIIIGDGPESDKVQKATLDDASIIWRGAVVKEEIIAHEMDQAHVVFVPGHSGLSIVHAFCYGKPYITSSVYDQHPPEISYLKNGINGILLSENLEADVNQIINLLTNDSLYTEFCNNAFNTAKRLSITNWCNQMSFALFNYRS